MGQKKNTQCVVMTCKGPLHAFEKRYLYMKINSGNAYMYVSKHFNVLREEILQVLKVYDFCCNGFMLHNIIVFAFNC